MTMVIVAAAAACRQAGPSPTWTDPSTDMEFVLIRPGTFLMGTPPDEPGREDQERLHQVTLTHPFYLGRFEVTQAQWARAMGSNPSQFAGCGPRCPIETVTYEDVQRLVATLNGSSRAGFRVPTEAEWEYACRAGRQGAFGDRAELTTDHANIDGRFPSTGPAGVFRAAPVPVGSFEANPWGLYDMSGNVWEWTADRHCPYPDAPVTDPVGACGSALQVIRGGSWRFDEGSARCGLRYTHRPVDRGYSLGIRLAHDAW